MGAEPETLILRADANSQIGSGHAMRCLSLAQAWQDRGGRAVFVMADPPPPIAERLQAENVSIKRLSEFWGSEADARCTAEFARKQGASWLVIDGYHFEFDYQRVLKDAGFRLLFIDDNGHAGRYCADLVLNHNPHAQENLYSSRDSQTRLLLGSRYAMLRREFEAWRDWKRQILRDARKVLITMGGSDPGNVTAAVIHALSQADVKGLEVSVVVGGGNPHAESLEQACACLPCTVRLHKNAANMAELLAWADVAVSGAGTTCWEMCLLGLPAVLIDLAENQRPVAEELERRGAAIHLGSADDVFPEEIAGKLTWLLHAPEERAAMSHHARELVDGKGAERVVAAMKCDLHLRRAQENDCRLLWEWANDPAVRAASFSGDAIPWERHKEWFRARTADRNALIYIAVNSEDQPVGQIRYELAGTEATVSISLSPQFRDRGYGCALLSQGTEELFRQTGATTISAYVKPENEPSLRLFRTAGFASEPAEIIRGQTALHFTLRRNGIS